MTRAHDSPRLTRRALVGVEVGQRIFSRSLPRSARHGDLRRRAATATKKLNQVDQERRNATICDVFVGKDPVCCLAQDLEHAPAAPFRHSRRSDERTESIVALWIVRNARPRVQRLDRVSAEHVAGQSAGQGHRRERRADARRDGHGHRSGAAGPPDLGGQRRRRQLPDRESPGWRVSRRLRADGVSELHPRGSAPDGRIRRTRRRGDEGRRARGVDHGQRAESGRRHRQHHVQHDLPA